MRTCLKTGMKWEKNIIYMYLSFFCLVCKGNRNRKQKWEFFFFINILVKQREGWKLMDEGVILWATKKLKNIYIKKKKKKRYLLHYIAFSLFSKKKKIYIYIYSFLPIYARFSQAQPTIISLPYYLHFTQSNTALMIFTLFYHFPFD